MRRIKCNNEISYIKSAATDNSIDSADLPTVSECNSVVIPITGTPMVIAFSLNIIVTPAVASEKKIYT